MKRLFTIIFLLASLIIGLYDVSAATTSAQDCTICHGAVISDFSEPNVLLVNKIRCYQCHSEGLHTRSYNGSKILVIYYNDPVTGERKGAVFLQDPNTVTTVNLHVYHSLPDPRASACAECHISFTCSSCHETTPHRNHSSTKYSQVSLWMTSGVFGGLGYYKNSCATANCHGKFSEPYKPTVTKADGQQLCRNCHEYDKSGHVDAPAKHATAYLSNPPFDCSQCHKTDLVSEHETRINDTGFSYDCVTCHKNTRVDVQTAITGKNSNCDACHVNIDHISFHESNTIDNNCGTCHKGNLIAEHLHNTITQKTTLKCNSCHGSTNLNILYAISSNNKGCAACHTTGHNINFVEIIPVDIPLYPGFDWSAPLDAGIWANESWFDSKYQENAKRIISNRRTDISIQQVKDYYTPKMTNNGWTLISEENLSGSTVLNFTYGQRKTTIMFYNTEIPKGTTFVSTGYRLDIFYR